MPENQQGDNSVLTTLFAHNTWANLKLLDFCETLTGEQLDTTATGCYGTIRDTLKHLVGSEVSYVERANGKLSAKAILRGEFPGFAVLKDAVRSAAEELLPLAISSRTDIRIQQSNPSHVIEYSLAALIVQSINHSTEHRAQISAIITQLGMEPPDMSGWAFMDATGDFTIVE